MEAYLYGCVASLLVAMTGMWNAKDNGKSKEVTPGASAVSLIVIAASSWFFILFVLLSKFAKATGAREKSDESI